jgi:prophage DNA circulation protein
MNWQELSSTSHYKTAVAIKNEIQTSNIAEAMTGIEELIEALSRSEKRALKSQLIRLMMHIIKWKTQPEKRTFSWIASIQDAREEIMDIQEETPSLNDAVIRTLWGKCFTIARRDAEAEMNRKTQLQGLSWKEVFDDEYELENIE